MDALLASLDYWQRLLVAYAIVVGAEAPLLLFVATIRRRRWYEQALALLPASAFGLGLYLARSVRDALDGWQSLITFQHVRYPPDYWPNFAREQLTDLQALVDSAQQDAIAMGVLTLLLLLCGWALLLRWLPNPGHAVRLASTAADATALPEEEQGSLEITIEPIEQEQR